MLLTGVSLGLLMEAHAQAALESLEARQAAPEDVASPEPETKVDRVVVTARRREEDIQDVPIAITTLGGDQLEATGAYRLDQLKQQVPSIQALSFNARNANVNIRGLGSNVALTNDGLEGGVGFYVDDVYYGRPGQSQFDLVDVQQVDILRGPQGTLFGKNTTAGAINITTREPSFKPEGSLELSAGDYGYQQERGSYSAPLVDGLLAFRASLASTHRDGNILNVHNGKEVGDYNNLTSRLQFLLTPSDRFKLRVIADYGSQAQNCCISVAAGTAYTRIDGTALPNNFAARAARIGYTPLPIDPFARRVDIDSPVRAEMWTGGLSAKADYTFDAFTVTSITAYRFWNWKPQNDGDGTSRPATIQGRIIDKQRQFSQELRIASDGHHTFDWVGGLYYYWQEVPGFQTSLFGPDGALFNLPPALYPTPAAASVATAALNGYQLSAYSNPETKSYAAFGQTTWNISPTWALTGGLRYTYEDKDGYFRQSVTGGAPLSSFPAASQALVTTIRNLIGATNSYSTSLEEDNVSGLATLSWKVTPDILGYGTYSRGYKSGGLNLSNLPPSAPLTVEPETVDHYEIGLKSDWFDGALTANFAGFWTEVDGYQTSFFDTDRFTTYISNVGVVRSRGVEADLHFQPFKGLTTYASTTFDDAEFVSYTHAPPPVEYTGLLPSTANFIDLSGRPLPGAPKWATSVGGEYQGRLPIDDVSYYIGSDYSYRSAYYASGNDARSSRIGDYALLNARLGLRFERYDADLSVWVKNAGDTHYFETLGGGNSGGSGLVTGIIGQPRTWGVTLRKKFG
jgi:iron complex outermembrane recepter protein